MYGFQAGVQMLKAYETWIWQAFKNDPHYREPIGC